MRKLYFYELVKLFGQRMFWIILAVLLILNAVLVMDNALDSKTAPLYKAVYNDLEGMTNKEKSDYLSDYYEQLNVYENLSWLDTALKNGDSAETEYIMSILGDSFEEYRDSYEAGDYLRYSDNLYVENTLIKEIIDEINTINGYAEYLDDIDSRAELMSKSSLFSNPDTFSYRNIQKTPAAFAHLKGSELKADISNGILTATQSDFTDILAIIFILYVSISVICHEVDQGLLNMVSASRNGKTHTAFAKLLAVTTICAGTLLLFYGINFLIGHLMYGFGDVNRLLQSVRGFIGSPYKLTVLQYFAMYGAVKLAGYVFAGLLFMFFAVVTKNSMVSYLFSGGFITVSVILNIAIQNTSWLNPLKYINCATLIRTNTIFRDYINLNVFGYPVPLPITLFIVLALFFMLLVILNVCRFNVITYSAGFRLFRRKSGTKKVSNRGSVRLLPHELYKLFIVNKGWLLLLVFIVMQFYIFHNTDTYFPVDELYYKQYMEYLSGPPEESKLEFLENEQKKFDDAAEQIGKLAEELDSGNISRFEYDAQAGIINEVFIRQPAFERAKEKYDYVLKQCSKGVDARLVYEGGYDFVTAANANQRDYIAAVKCMCFLIICAASVFAYEYKNNSIRLVRSYKNGRTKLFVGKEISALLIVPPVMLITYAPEIWYAVKTFGLSQLDASAVSLTNLSHIPATIKIWEYLLQVFAVRLLWCILAVQIVLLITAIVKNFYASVIVSSVALVLPLLLSMMGIEFVSRYTMVPVAAGNAVFASDIGNMWILYIAIAAVLTVTAFVIGLCLAVNSWSRAKT